MNPKIYYYTKSECIEAFWKDMCKSCKQRKTITTKTKHEKLVEKFNQRYGNSNIE